MTALVEFLLERIAEERAHVDAVPDWYCTNSARGEGWGSRGDCRLCGAYMFDGTEDVTEQAHWDHLEDAHRRRFVLAECEAKRRIAELHSEGEGGTCETCYIYASGVSNHALACPTLRSLGLPYADHPDYREEWRP